MKAVTAGMLLLLAPIGAALAQDASSNYPNKTVRMIIPFAPGGATDVIGRIISERLAAKGRGRLALVQQLWCGDTLCLEARGDYAVLP